MSKTSKQWYPALLAGLLAVAAYAITIRGTYIYDDVYIAKLDPRLKDVSRWGEYFTRAYFPDAPDHLFRPITSFSFALGWWVFGDRAWVLHLINILLHGVASALVAELGRRISGRRAAYIAGILFAVHPVHVEVIAGLVGRAESLCAIGILAGLILFLGKRMSYGRALAIFGCMIFAVLSKEQGLLLPAFLLGFVPLRKEHLGRMPEEKKAMQMLVVLMCWSVAGYIAFREQSHVFKFSWDPTRLDWTVNPLMRATALERWLLPFDLLGRYVGLLVWPSVLRPDYYGVTGYAVDWGQPWFYMGVAAVVGWWWALGWAIWGKRRAALGCLIGLAIAYSMVSNFGVLIGTNFGERLMYLPSVYFLLLVSMGIAELRGRWGAIVTVCLAVLGVIRVETYAWRWNDAKRFYTMSLAETPKNARLCMLMMDELRKAGDLAGAAKMAAQGREVAPDYWRIWFYSAVIADDRGRYDEAIGYLHHARELAYVDEASCIVLEGKIQEKMNPSKGATRPVKD